MPVVTRTAAETRLLGQRLATRLLGGDVVLLTGELGAGKSEFARGIAEGMGVVGPVPSPTFTLLNVYDTPAGELRHFDWYRIRDPEELFIAGLDEFVGGEGVTLIEWHERAEELIPHDHIEVRIRAVREYEREIEIVPFGRISPERLGGLG